MDKVIDDTCGQTSSRGDGCVLAPSIMDAASSTTVPVHLFKPHSYPVFVRQDSVVGQVEPVLVVSTFQVTKTVTQSIISQQQNGCTEREV